MICDQQHLRGGLECVWTAAGRHAEQTHGYEGMCDLTCVCTKNQICVVYITLSMEMSGVEYIKQF